MKKGILFLTAIILLILCFNSFANDAKKEKIAVKVTDKWIKLIDEGKYSEAWDEAADFLQKSITKEKWIGLMSKIRSPLGEVKNRELIRKGYETSFIGGPEGEYVVVQYSVDFENKKYSVETITPTLDKDGKWKVSGYYIN